MTKFNVGDKVKVKELSLKGVVIDIRISEDFTRYKVAEQGNPYPKYWNEESLGLIL